MTIRKIGCRICQLCLKGGMYLLPWRTPEVMKGKGASERIPISLRRMGLKKPLIVTGPHVRAAGLLEKMLETLNSLSIPYVIFDGVTPNPSDKEVENGVTVFRDNHCDCLIAFGGGSPMDCAKAVGARIARPKKKIAQLQGLFRVIRPIPVLFAVPTTAGSGSETTIAAVVTETGTKHKAPLTDLQLMPRYVVLDPVLTRGLPKKVTAAGGMDALCHAVESYVNHMYHTGLEDRLAVKAVRLIYENFLRAYENGDDLEARQKMQEAAFFAGRAFTRGCVGYAHAAGHPLSSLYGTSHGIAVGILLPHVLRAYGRTAYKRLAELCDVCGLADSKASPGEKAEAFISWIEMLKEKTGIPEFPDMICRDDVDQIAEWADEEANPLYPVPRIMNRKEIKKWLLTLIYRGTRKESESAKQKDKAEKEE